MLKNLTFRRRIAATIAVAAVLTTSVTAPAYAVDDNATPETFNEQDLSATPQESSPDQETTVPEKGTPLLQNETPEAEERTRDAVAPSEAPQLSPLAATALPEPLLAAPAAQALRPASGGTKRFTDVPKTHKFYKSITWMYQAGLTTGVKQYDGTVAYLPSSGLSREAMAAFLYREAGSPKFTMPKRGFTDVPSSHKFYKPIMWMKASGLSTGYADGSYQPSAGLSREAMAAFLYRQAGKPKAKAGTRKFGDVPGGHKFAKEIIWMRSAGITTGYADGTYKPKDGVSREAMAAFLYRIAGSPAFIESGTVKITGTAAVGNTLKSSVAGWAPSKISYSYQWLRNGATINGATNASYQLAAADQGKQIQVAITGKLTGAASVKVTSSSTGNVAAKPATVADIENRVLYLVNKERQARGLHILWKSGYQLRAREWSQYLVDNNKYEHSFSSNWFANTAQGYLGMGGENIGSGGPRSKGLGVADELFASWMNSAGHRAVILNPSVASVGVGIAFQAVPGADECDPGFFDCGPNSVYALATLVTSKYYPDNLSSDLFPYSDPNCHQNPSFQECSVPGGRSLPGRTPPNGLWG